MIFEALQESARRGELLLVENGYCRWHLRKDGQITILEIISTRRGAGQVMLDWLRWYSRHHGAYCLVARCPADLEANGWYERRGFIKVSESVAKTGRKVNVWRLLT